jgi:phosphatidate cytidylyltransferase
MLGWRLFLGPILVALLGGVFYLDAYAGRTAPCLLVLCLLLGIRSSWELVQLLRIRSFEPQMGLVTLCSVAVIASNWYERWRQPAEDIYVREVGALGLPMLVFAISFLLLMLSEAIRYRGPGKSMESLGAELIIVSYVGILISIAAQLRWVAGSDAGYLALGSLVVTTKAGDIGAYFLGRYWGRRKLIERLSPGKTWMGARGALLGAGLGSLAWFEWGAPLFNPDWPRCPWYWALFYGVAIGLVGLVGDLCESLIKRDLGQKDSASLLPGYGGLLDMLDSVIYAAPVAYWLWLILPLGP